MANLRELHAAAKHGQLIGVFPAAHLGDGVDERRGVRVAGPVVETQTGMLRIDRLEQHQLPRAAAGRLAVVPRHHRALLDVGLLDRGRQAVVVDQLGVAVAAQQQHAAEAGAQAEGIDVKVGQVHQVQRVTKADVIAVRPGLQPLPETQAPLPTAFRREHGRVLVRTIAKVLKLVRPRGLSMKG